MRVSDGRDVSDSAAGSVEERLKAVHEAVTDLQTRIERLEQIINEGFKAIANRLVVSEGRLNALLRLQYVGNVALPYPERFVARRVKFMSNDEDDGITLSILGEIGVTNRRFVEIGCGTNGGNSGFLALECGWSGLMIDANGARAEKSKILFRYADVEVLQTFVTRENINALLSERGITGEIDLLSIDIDGNDYWIWDALTVIAPRLVIAEYNSYFGPEKSLVIPYEPEFDRHNYKGFYYGASITALSRLAARKGYRLIATEPRGHNCYFLRNDVSPSIPATDPRKGWRLLNKYEKRVHKGAEDIYKFVERARLQLVEVS